MSLHESLREDLKTALKAKDETRLRTVRGIMTACTNELVATNRTPQSILTDEEVQKVISRLTKQRKESITQFEAAGRQDLADPEKAELEILQSYLPTLMTAEEILPIAEAKKAELGITDKGKIGILIGAIMKEVGSKADGATVKAVTETLF